MKYSFFLFLVLAVLGCQSNDKPAGTAGKTDGGTAVPLKNAQDSASYAFGVVVANSIKRQMSADLKEDVMLQGFNAVMNGGNVGFTMESANMVFSNYTQKVHAQQGGQTALEGEKFLAENKNRQGVTTTPSGLQYEVLKRGTGIQSPKATDQVKVHYHGTTIDGQVFDSSVDRGQPASFGLNQVIKGWTEGLQYMKIGDKFKFYIPSNLAYGERSPSAKIKPNAMLIFEVELLAIN